MTTELAGAGVTIALIVAAAILLGTYLYAMRLSWVVHHGEHTPWNELEKELRATGHDDELDSGLESRRVALP